jgi:hypothetical protein
MKLMINNNGGTLFLETTLYNIPKISNPKYHKPKGHPPK